LGALGDTYGMSFLLDGLDYPDDLVRESFFECFLDLTGVSHGYAPRLVGEDRLYSLANLRNWWATEGGAGALRTPRSLQISAKQRAAIEAAIKEIGGDDMHASTPENDEQIIAKLREFGELATPMLIDGLKWPSGFSAKRVGILRVLADGKDPYALAALIDASRDQVTAVALWAVEGLGAIRNPAGIEATLQFEQRLEGLAAAQRVPRELGSADSVRALVARARGRMGDAGGGDVLLGLLWSRDSAARLTAEAALLELYGDEHPKEPSVAVIARRALEQLPEARARELETLQRAWDVAIEAAEQAGERAKTTAERLAALALYDRAEAATARYATLDARAFQQDFERTSAGSNAVAEGLQRDAAWIENLPWRDALSRLERSNWSLDALGNASAQFTEKGLVLQWNAAPNAPVDWNNTAALSFGARDGWRDFEYVIELKLEAGAFALVNRCDENANGEWSAVFATSDQDLSAGECFKLRVNPSDRILHTERVLGGVIVSKRGIEDVTIADASTQSRSGGLGLVLASGTRLVISSLKVRPLRIDALMSAK
jgi:hypothetical protein